MDTNPTSENGTSDPTPGTFVGTPSPRKETCLHGIVGNQQVEAAKRRSACIRSNHGHRAALAVKIYGISSPSIENSSRRVSG